MGAAALERFAVNRKDEVARRGEAATAAVGRKQAQTAQKSRGVNPAAPSLPPGGRYFAGSTKACVTEARGAPAPRERVSAPLRRTCAAPCAVGRDDAQYPPRRASSHLWRRVRSPSQRQGTGFGLPRPVQPIWLGLIFALAACGTGASLAAAGKTVLFVAGAPGEDIYASNLVRQAALWSNACALAGAQLVTVGLGASGPGGDRVDLQDKLAAQAKEGSDPLWLVLAGHGTFDGQEARFNLRGPDLTPADLAAWLEPFRRPLVVINTASASAPFIKQLAGTNRVVITATRSGHEHNYARFGDYLATTLTDPAADLDQDGQTSLLEAVLSASARVAEFYKNEGRLATEHALIEDTGDGLGTPADWFRGVRAVKRPASDAMLDGARAHQIHLIPSAAERTLPVEVRARRDALERAVFRLRETKSGRPEEEYLRELEQLLLELARLLDDAERRP